MNSWTYPNTHNHNMQFAKHGYPWSQLSVRRPVFSE